MSSNLGSYGGNVQVVATEHEINRVASQLAAVEKLLVKALVITELRVPVSTDPRQLLFLAELPIWVARLRYLQFCLWVSAQSYYSTEAQVRNLMQQALPNAVPILAGALATKPLKSNEFLIEKVGENQFATAPNSLRNMMNRLETTAEFANGTVRIESWWSGGKHHFIVYLPGTQDWSPFAGSNPLNLPSDIQAAGNKKSDTETAILLALKKAGAKPGDELIFVAHSQGGLVAAKIAEHPNKYQVSSILSFASPMVAIGAISATKVLAFEHTNDAVPYLANKANPLAPNWLTLQAMAKKSGTAAHDLVSYGQMASAADASKSAAIAAARQSLLTKFRGKRVKVQLFKLQRKPKG